MEFINAPEWGKYVSPISDRIIVPYNWYAFKHRFGSQLIAKMAVLFDLKKGDTIFDPYCGGATTLIKAKIDGYHSLGLDISPFSVFLANALTCRFNPMKLHTLLSSISHEINENCEIPDVAILNKSFSNTTLKYIFSLKAAINEMKSKERNFLLLSLLCILNDISKSKKSGGFLRISNRRKVTADRVRSLFIKNTIRMIDELESYKFRNVAAKAVLGDARNYPKEIKGRKFDAIMTSPPYPNRHDYTRIYELELLVGFIENNKSLKDLRYHTLRSHIEARKVYTADDYRCPQRLTGVIEDLSRRDLNNPKLIAMLNGYFEDMYLSLREMSTVLKPGKHIGLIVSNVRYAGVMVPVDELLAEIGEQVGLSIMNIYVLRYRGNSAQQMLRHKRQPTRESLIVWRKPEDE